MSCNFPANFWLIPGEFPANFLQIPGKCPTHFFSRFASFQLKITHLVMKNEILQNLSTRWVISSWKLADRLEKIVGHFSKPSDDIPQENLRIWRTNLDHIRDIWVFVDWNAQKF